MDELDTSEPQDEAIGEGDKGNDTLRADLPLRERMAVLEREWREMQVEWLSMYDQFRSLYGRISRRQQREEKAQQPDDRPLNPAAMQLLRGGER